MRFLDQRGAFVNTALIWRKYKQNGYSYGLSGVFLVPGRRFGGIFRAVDVNGNGLNILWHDTWGTGYVGRRRGCQVCQELLPGCQGDRRGVATPIGPPKRYYWRNYTQTCNPRRGNYHLTRIPPPTCLRNGYRKTLTSNADLFVGIKHLRSAFLKGAKWEVSEGQIRVKILIKNKLSPHACTN